ISLAVLCLGLALPVIASDLGNLNQAFQAILKSYNILGTDGSPLVSSALNFHRLQLSASSVEAVDVEFNYFRKGLLRDFLFNLRGRYENTPQSQMPTAMFDVTLNSDAILASVSPLFGTTNLFNLSKLELENLINSTMESTLKEAVDSQTNTSGVDLQWSTIIQENSQQKVQSLKLKIFAAVDLAQIKDPAVLAEERMESVEITFNLNKQMTSAQIKAVLNPKASGFQKNQEGLKELLDKVMGQDPEVLSFAQSLAGSLDKLAIFLTEN
ncbi:MAG: hypothetical protein WCH11_07305, partial [Bdellovibrio sp.]